MKYVCKLKYEQNKGFKELLAKTKGKIIVEDATMQNTNESVLKWGCQDLEKKSLIKEMRKQVQKAIRELQKSAKVKTDSLKKPRSAQAQKRFDDKLDHQISSMEKSLEICEKTIMSNAHFTFSGKNTMGKILTLLRDTDGDIEYNLELRNPDHGRPVNPFKIPLKRYSFTYKKGEKMSKKRPKPAAALYFSGALSATFKS